MLGLSVKVVGMIGAVFIVALVIIVYAPTDCIKVEFFNSEIEKCKSLTQEHYPGEASAHVLLAFAQTEPITTNISGSWNISGHAGDHFQLNGTAHFSSLAEGMYRLVTNEINENGTYHFDGKTLSLTSSAQKTTAFHVMNLLPNSFDIMSGRQQYHLSR